jgi:hypothetical protein
MHASAIGQIFKFDAATAQDRCLNGRQIYWRSDNGRTSSDTSALQAGQQFKVIVERLSLPAIQRAFDLREKAA